MRTVLRNKHEVFHFWANQRQYRGKAGNVFFMGPTIYSYGTHFPMATIVAGVYVMTTRTYSPTTSGHMAGVHRAIPHGAEIIRVIHPLDPPHTQIEETLTEIQDLVGKAKRARKYGEFHLAQAAEKARNFNRYLELLGASERIDLNVVVGGNVEKLIEDYRAKRAEEERVEALRKEEEKRELVEAWLAGDPITCPHTFRPRLRLKDYTGQMTGFNAGRVLVETSWGAYVHVEDAKRLWPTISLCHRRGREFTPTEDRILLGGYELQRITKDGDIVVGCHHIEYSEIEKIARQLGLLQEEALAA